MLSKIGCIQALSFWSLSPGRYPMSRPSGMIGRGAQHLLIDLFIERLGQSRRQGQEGLSRPGRADQGNKLHRIIQQQIEAPSSAADFAA